MAENDQEKLRIRGREILQHLIGTDNFERRAEAENDFNRDFQALSEKYAFGTVWDRKALDWRARSLLCVSALAALRLWGPLRLHIHSALNNGVTIDELRETVIHLSIYIGLPSASELGGIVEKVLLEREATQEEDSSGSPEALA